MGYDKKDRQDAEQSGRRDALSLAPLLAEMLALGSMLPGHAPETEQERIAHDAEVEAGFDNMPV
jgi:hypothetical protein